MVAAARGNNVYTDLLLTERGRKEKEKKKDIKKMKRVGNFSVYVRVWLEGVPQLINVKQLGHMGYNCWSLSLIGQIGNTPPDTLYLTATHTHSLLLWHAGKLASCPT